MAKKLYTTPRGVLGYPYLLTPDTKYEPKGEYKTKLHLGEENGAPLAEIVDGLMEDAYIAKLAEAQATAKEKGKKIPKKLKRADAPYQRDEETGDYSFSFKLIASGVRKKDGQAYTQRPALFNIDATPITEDLRIGGGSEAKISFEGFQFYTALIGAGISLRLKAVQILKLVEFGGDAEYFGFDDEDPDSEVEPGEEEAEETAFEDESEGGTEEKEDDKDF